MSITHSTTFVLEFEFQGVGDPNSLRALIVSYLTEPQNPFLSDYAPSDQPEGRSDGWDGPFITGVKERNFRVTGGNFTVRV